MILRNVIELLGKSSVRRMCSARVATASQLKIHRENGLKVITLANPKTRNALSLTMLNELKVELNDDDEDLRCIILNAEGKVFSAGHNLKELVSSTGKPHHNAVFTACTDLMQSIPELQVPVIAQVDGIAAAAGCQLVASCDIVLATENSSFVTPGATVGIFCSTPGIPLVRNVPRKVGADMLLTGLPIDARRAQEAGLVSEVVTRDEMEAATQKRVDAICSKSRSVIALGKKFMYRQMNLTFDEAYREGGDVMVENINMKDGQEGIEAFIKKRKPVWTHCKD